jgi:anti-sigma factor RsiW
MNHEQAQALMEAYVDDQLDVGDTLGVEAHLDECDQCRAWVADRRALIARLRSAPLSYSIPPHLANKLRTLLIPRRRWAFPEQWPRALAAGLVLGFLGLWVGHSLPQRPDLSDEWVSAHVRSTLSSRPLDVLSSSHHTVKPWLSSKLPFSPPVPDLNDQGDTLLGARVDYIEHSPVAALVYQHGNHRIDVFVWPSAHKPIAKLSGASIEGFRLIAAQARGFNAVIVSDMSVQELDAFRDRWSAQAALQ